MKFAGIIAEYDPFHNGHAWQLAQAKALGAQHVAVAMSCGLTQRGRTAAAAGSGAGAGRPAVRGRSDICAACALCLCGGRGFCPGGGAHPCRRRVRCAGVRGQRRRTQPC